MGLLTEAVLCHVCLAQVSSSLWAHVTHDKHSGPFDIGSVLFIISVCCVSSSFSTWWKVLKTVEAKKRSVSRWVKNMFIRHIIFFVWIKPAASFSDLGWIPLALSLLDLSGSGAVYSDGCSDFFITCPGRSLCLLFLFLAPWKICISFELLWLQF